MMSVCPDPQLWPEHGAASLASSRGRSQ